MLPNTENQEEVANTLACG